MLSPYPRLFRGTLFFIATVQFILGLVLLLAPERFADSLGFAVTPAWANWLFGQMAARAIGFGFGMVVAARHIEQARPWIWAMIVVQALDWLVTLKYLLAGAMSLGQVSTAPYFPILFIVLLLLTMPKTRTAAQAS